MRAMSRRLHRMPEAAAPAERPVAVVVVLAETTRTPEADRPPEAEATPDRVLAHLDFDLAVRLFDDAAMAENTRNKYVGALRRYESWLDGRPPTDRLLADHLGAMYDGGLAPPSAVTAVAAVKRAALESARAGYEIAEPPAGDLAAQRRERFRREGAGRGRGQAGPLRWEDADEMCKRAEADDDPRGIRDAALIGVISSALLRIAEASALDAGDVSSRRTARRTSRSAAVKRTSTGTARSAISSVPRRRGSGNGWTPPESSPGRCSAPCPGAASGRRGWARRRFAPSSSAGRSRPGSPGACPGTRCASAPRSRWWRRARRSWTCRLPAAGSRRRCRPTTSAYPAPPRSRATAPRDASWLRT